MNGSASPNSTPLVIVLFLLVLGCASTLAQTTPAKPSTYEEAVQLYKNGDNAGAIEILQKVVRADAYHADAWYFLGLAYYKSEALWRAGDAFDRMFRLRPNLADTHAREAHAKLSVALILGGQDERAIASAKRAIELGDQSAEPYYTIAEASWREGKYVNAVDRANEALKINPGFGLTLITKSMALYYLNRYAESIACLEEFLKLNPNDLDADVWSEQLSTLRVFERCSKSPETAVESEPIFKGRDVTTKARVLAKPEPIYTESARQAGVTGTVVLKAVFSSKGEVTNIFVARPLSHGLNSRAVAAAKGIRFVPATKDGQPVSMWMELQYNFNLY